MKKKVLIVSLSTLLVILAICGYLIYCYFTPSWQPPGVGFPISSPPHSAEQNDYQSSTPR